MLKSGYFDAKYYLRQNEDVRRSDIDPLVHYVKYGWREGKSPSERLESVVAENSTQLDLTTNPVIRLILNERKEKNKTRVSIIHLLRFLIRGCMFLLKFNGPVIFGGYPYPERERDGYYQRIRSIDTLFYKKWRIYIDRGNLQDRNFWYDTPAERVLVLRVGNDQENNKLSRFFLGISLLRSRLVYFHSVFAVAGVEAVLKLPWIKKIIDVHGVVPEEFHYQEDLQNSRYFNEVEKTALYYADYIVVVSEAMRQHLESKYHGNLHGKYIYLPIIQDIPIAHSVNKVVYNAPIIVYAGGIQKWQQVPRMIDAIVKTSDRYQYRFYCSDPESVLRMLPEKLRYSPSIKIDSKPPEEMMKAYEECHYGFILREEIIVNLVACPTKLMEYLASGIVPIVDSENIGDFKELGMKFVRLNDLLSFRLPDEFTRRDMVKANFDVYFKLLKKYKDGVQELLRLN